MAGLMCTYDWDGQTFYKFTGHERDSESGLDHTEYRKFASTAGRWLSPDRVRGNPANPQSWNRYAYTVGNPTNFTDPSGAVIDVGITGCLPDPSFLPFCIDAMGGGFQGIISDADPDIVLVKTSDGSCTFASALIYAPDPRCYAGSRFPAVPVDPHSPTGQDLQINPPQPNVLFTLFPSPQTPPVITISSVFVPTWPFPWICCFGPAIAVTTLPDGTVCVGLGAGAGLGAGVNSAPLVLGDTSEPLDVVEGWSVQVTLQPTPGLGATVVASPTSPNALGGNSVGTPGRNPSVTITYSGCVPPPGK